MTPSDESRQNDGARERAETERPLSSTPSAELDSRLEALLIRWQELRDEGQILSPQEMCPEDPAEASEFELYLEKFQTLERMMANVLVGPKKAATEVFPEVPGYEIVERLGQGGMGVVYRAWQARLNRNVALKVIQSDTWSDLSTRHRFDVEAKAIARLNHPNIVQIYEVGQHEGRLFFSLEYCQGGSLADWLNGVPLQAKQAATLCESLCRAVQHAHERGIIHRDLKPANVVLQFADGSTGSRDAASLSFAIPKVTDFGLARNVEEIGQTRVDAVIGTPSYMSPEQARGAIEITPLSDVYSLGAILYELLTGRPPFRGSSVMETVRQVLYDEPISPVQFNPQMPRDLENICLKALHKEPARRYASTGEFAEDLRCYLRGETVKARPISVPEKIVRWCRRNPGWATAMVAAILLLVIAWQLTWQNITQARKSLFDLQKEQSRTLTEQGKTKEALAKANKSLYLANIAQAHSAWQSLRGLSTQQFLDQCPEEFRQWEWHFLSELSRRSQVTWQHESSGIEAVAFDKASQHIALCTREGKLKILRSDDGKSVFQSQLDEGTRANLAIFNDGQHVAFVGSVKSLLPFGGMRSELVVMDTQTQDATPFRWSPRGSLTASDLAYCSATKKVAVACASPPDAKKKGQVHFFDSESFPPKFVEMIEMPMPGGRILDLSADGTTLAVAGGDRFIYLLSTETKMPVAKLEAFATENAEGVARGIYRVSIQGKTQEILEWGVNRVVFSHDGKYIAAGLSNGQIRVWDTATHQLQRVFQCGDFHVYDVSFSPDNRTVAAASLAGNAVHLFELESGRALAAFQGHADRITKVLFTDDQRLLSASFDSTVREWNLNDRSSSQSLVGHRQSVWAVAFSRDGKNIVTGDGDMFKDNAPGAIRWWDLKKRESILHLPLETCGVSSLQFNGRGDQLAAACSDGKVRVWEKNNTTPKVLPGHLLGARGVSWRPGSSELASVSGSILMYFLPSEAAIWDTEKLTKRKSLEGHASSIGCVAYSQDARWLATASSDKTVKIWDADSGELIRTLRGPNDAILSLAIDPRGRWIAAGTGDILQPLQQKPGEIYVWDQKSGEVLHVLRGHTQMVNSLTTTPDGERLASCARSDKIRIWEPATGMEILALAPSDYACNLFYSPDGKTLVVCNWNGTLDLFSAETYAP